MVGPRLDTKKRLGHQTESHNRVLDASLIIPLVYPLQASH